MFNFFARKKRAGLALLLVAAAELFPHCVPLAHAEIFKALSTDGADYSCQVVLRQARLIRETGTGLPRTETDPNNQSWYTFEATVDAAAAPLKAGAQVALLYRSKRDSLWHVAPGEAISGAAPSLQRHSFRIAADTLKAAEPQTSAFPPYSEELQVIPFIKSADGRRIFDHNGTSTASDTYILNAQNSWMTGTPPELCERAGLGSATLRFLADWSTEARGELHPGQSMLVEYDLSRLPQCHGSSYNGLPAWQTEAFVRFFPGGEESSAVLNAFYGGSMNPLPARFDIPEGANRAQLWFKTRGRSCEGSYDSFYGKNYEFEIKPAVTSSPSWAGQWQLLSGSAHCDSLSLARPLGDTDFIHPDDFENLCHAIEAEVLVPGLTTAPTSQPQSIQAQVQWKTDAHPTTTQWLTFAGRSGQNYRYRWPLPAQLLRSRPWNSLDFTFRFSTDGVFWLEAGRNTDRRIGVVEPRRIELNP